MARSAKSPFQLVIILLVVMAILTFAAVSMYEGYRSVDCLGISCPEGQFCQSNTCHPIYPPSSGE
jgi:hypothetical protein